ncbi:helix-turn-helix domain-containing protein [bacterium]|nr:helix-turn-helix domain-containing protein [bacterium]
MRGVNDIQSLILSHHSDPSFCVQKLASMAGMSTSYLRECIHRTYQVSPHELIEVCRLEQAIRLLKTSYLPVEVVATKAGFWSTKTFRRALRRKFGCRPSDYRQNPDPAKPQ